MHTIAITLFIFAVNVASAAQPNILLILADDLGHGDLGSYGGTLAETPNLDQLAFDGMRFAQAYAASSCSPSRTMLLTGQWPWRWNIHAHLDTHAANQARGMPDWLDPAAPSLARMLQDAGYRTAHIGKWHLGHAPGAPPVTAYGFNEVRQLFIGQGEHQLDRSKPYWRARSTAKMVTAALGFIERAGTQPWYLQIHLIVPHAILEPTPAMLARYEHLRPDARGYQGQQTVYAATLDGSIDRPLGRLLRRLDMPDLAENTIVIFTSDNGPEHPGRRQASHSGGGRCNGRGHKRSLYECGIKVPMIVRWPGQVPASVVRNTVVSLVDLVPTLAALTGVAPPAATDGEDMSDVWRGTDRPRVRPVLWERLTAQRATNALHVSPPLAVRDGPWKLLTDGAARVELYDLPSDPYEVDNKSTETPETVDRLMGLLLD